MVVHDIVYCFGKADQTFVVLIILTCIKDGKETQSVTENLPGSQKKKFISNPDLLLSRLYLSACTGKVYKLQKKSVY